MVLIRELGHPNVQFTSKSLYKRGWKRFISEKDDS